LVCLERIVMSGKSVGVFVAVLGVLALGGYRAFQRHVHPIGWAPPPSSAPNAAASESAHPGFLYGRVSTLDGAAYEGRLRWGGGEEAFWGDFFNGGRKETPWVAYAPRERLPKQSVPIQIFGVEIARQERPFDLSRPFMARFGDIERIEASGRDVRVTLKSGTLFELDRFSASDFDDGVRVWDRARGVVSLGNIRIRTIELLPAPRSGAVPDRLYGVVRTRRGDEFTGFVQWDREQSLGSDELAGDSDGGERRVRFGAIRSIARRTRDSALVTLLDGGEMALSGGRAVGQDNRGAYVDDARYGRVLVSWDAFERVDFRPGGSGPAYGDFPPGAPLSGSVVTRDGRRRAGRLVYDLDESETTETLDAPAEGVHYTIPLGLIASIVLPGPEERGPRRALVTLRRGERLQLECAGDLGPANAGLLIFVDGHQGPEYVSWADVEQIALDRPRAMYPPLGAPGGR
jgi:hypothetical protein